MKKLWWIGAALFMGLILGNLDETIQMQTGAAQAEATVKIDTSTYLFVTGNRVRQRRGPSTTYRIVGQLNQGARVRVLEASNGWTHIVSSLGNGWMSSKYLSSNRPIQKKETPRKAVRKVATPSSREITNAREAIIRQSIASYPGSCPCPYNRDRGGRRCGGRSAWSRPGGYSPICYESDVSQARLKTYFARQR